MHAYGDFGLLHHALAVFFAVAGVAAALGDDVDIIQIQLDFGLVQIGNTREAADAVLSGAAELGLVEGEVDGPGLIQSRIGADEVVVLPCAADAAQLERLASVALAGPPWSDTHDS